MRERAVVGAKKRAGDEADASSGTQAAEVLALQRSAGNRAVAGALLARQPLTTTQNPAQLSDAALNAERNRVAWDLADRAPSDPDLQRLQAYFASLESEIARRRRRTTPAARLANPREHFQNLVAGEAGLLADAQFVSAFLRTSGAAAGAVVDPAAIVADRLTKRRLRAGSRTAAGLSSVLDVLVQYGVLSRDAGGQITVSDLNGPPQQALDADAGRIATFRTAFDRRVETRNLTNPLVRTELIDPALAAGAQAERREEQQALDALAALETQLAAATTQEVRDRLTPRVERARRRVANAQSYRTFATSVADFLRRLQAKNSRFSAGNYHGHFWGEFSADIFLRVPQTADGFYRRPDTQTFFADVNETANESGPFGLFSWHAVYNDPQMVTHVRTSYGQQRIHTAPHHGPAPDKLHIHLDLRPVDLQPDEVTGFDVVGGRVRLRP